MTTMPVLLRRVTARQQASWDAYQRHGGDGTPGAQTAAAHELGVSNGAIKSATDGYRKAMGLDPAPRLRASSGSRVKTTEQFADLIERYDAVERQVANLLASQAALSVQVHDLLAEVRGLLGRQPLILEVRATHRRKADGGIGGRAEGRRSFRSIEEAIRG